MTSSTLAVAKELGFMILPSEGDDTELANKSDTEQFCDKLQAYGSFTEPEMDWYKYGANCAGRRQDLVAPMPRCQLMGAVGFYFFDASQWIF